MEYKWIGCAQENFRKARPAGLKPEMIVLHSINGSLADADSRFNRPDACLSAHYAVGSGGEVHQYVSESDTAYHAGFVVNPTARLVKERPKINPNFYSIGIEQEGKPGGPWTSDQLAATATLLREISKRWCIPLDIDHVIAHSEVRASVNCPGSGAAIAHLLDMPVEDEHATSSSIMPVTLISNVNLRSGASIAAPVVRVATAKSRMDAEGFVIGDTVNGNSFWYRNRGGIFFWAGATDRPNPCTSGQPADIDATTDTMNRQAPSIDRSSLRLAAGQFYPERQNKDLIVLHFTAGMTARSAFDTWLGDPEHIATAYIVDKDGAIYEVFDPASWAFHLGAKGTNGRHDKRSIGIEIANVGPLRPSSHDQAILNWWPSDFGKKYCSLHDKDRYVETSFRDVRYFASFPLAQVESVRDLVSHLCERFSISKVLPPKVKQFVCDLDFFKDFSGVASHANFRKDKWDIGPGFQWDALGIKNAPG